MYACFPDRPKRYSFYFVIFMFYSFYFIANVLAFLRDDAVILCTRVCTFSCIVAGFARWVCVSLRAFCALETYNTGLQLNLPEWDLETVKL